MPQTSTPLLAGELVSKTWRRYKRRGDTTVIVKTVCGGEGRHSAVVYFVNFLGKAYGLFHRVGLSELGEGGRRRESRRSCKAT